MQKHIDLTKDQKELLILLLKKKAVKKNSNLALRCIAIILLDKGLTIKEVANCLALSIDAVTNYLKKYKSGQEKELLATHYVGKCCALDIDKQNQLKEYLSKNTFYSVIPIINYVLLTFNQKYSKSGMRKLLHNLGFSYKKPCIIGAKADYLKQKVYQTI